MRSGVYGRSRPILNWRTLDKSWPTVRNLSEEDFPTSRNELVDSIVVWNELNTALTTVPPVWQILLIYSPEGRGTEIRGTKSASVKVGGGGLPRALSVCDIASASSVGQVRGGASLPNLLNTVCISSPVTSSRINRAETVRRSKWNRSNRISDSERRCYSATEREPLAEEDKAEASGSEFRSYGLSKLSHFLRELTRQDCWAGLLEPFQGAGNFNPGNYSHPDWKPRTPVSAPIPHDHIPSDMTTPDFNSHVSNAPCGPYSTEEPEQPTTSGGTATSEYAAQLAACVPHSDVRPGTVFVSTRWSQASSDDVGSLGVATPNNGTATVNGSAPPKVGLNGSSNRILDKPHAELCHKLATCVTAEEIGSCENLASWLEERIGISVLSRWGNSAATKRVANLWCELVEGEISLEDSRPPKRTAHVASVKIRNDKGHVLVEAYQQMADGRIRPRNRPLSEKMRPGEHVEEACLRGIYEELGCQMGARERVVIIPESYRREEEERESFSYPGLPTRYVIHTMVAHVDQLPSTEFSTEEDESNHGSSVPGAGSNDESASRSTSAPVGVKRHFWKWVPENKLAEFCRR